MSYERDRAEIADLMARYLFAMDYMDADAYAECFVEDGVLDYAMGTTTGREAIRAEAHAFRENIARIFVDWQGNPAKLRHLVQQKAIRIEGDRAWNTGFWWEMTNAGPEGRPKAESFGTYEDELVRVDGRWLFQRRKIYNEFLPGRESGAVNPVLAMDTAAGA
ncbi:MAG TPA: nuclear transport factor 2 family protein [Croceibacterium sp.]|nr:nuclear transport factor 2 family protein [Croceibacterium sp.]